ncbi:MAG TPA: hypothetical protein ENI23_07410 [bacterium]|nr:hypothetical protein [bacterium]
MTKTKIEVTLKDHSVEAHEESKSIDMIIEITEEGIEIYPKEVEQHYNGIYIREIWVEFYLGTLRVITWDGTQKDPVTEQDLLEVVS